MATDDLTGFAHYMHVSDAYWQAMPDQDNTWLWLPHWLALDGTVDDINRLTAAGWIHIPTPSLSETGMELYMLFSQCADVRFMDLPGRDDRAVWTRADDWRRVEAAPVILSFSVPMDRYPPAEMPVGRQIAVAQMLPPPQFGETALVQVQRHDATPEWVRYSLDATGKAGLELWRRMGATLTALAAPAEWWIPSPTLTLCLRGEDTRLREDLRSKLLASRGQEREMWREQLAQLEIDRRRAKAIRTAKERARKDPTAWLEQWREVRDMAAELAALYWAAHQHAVSVPDTIAHDAEPEDPEADVTVAVADARRGNHVVVEPLPTEDAEAEDVFETLAQIVDATDAPSFDTPSYTEDRAARRAMLSDKDKWSTESDMYRYGASKNLAVYFGDPKHPLELKEALSQLLRIRESTVLSVRIAEAIWNQRRHDPRYVRSGAVAITYNEILQWRGVKKHSRAASPGSARTFSDGYRTEDREDIRTDFALARLLYLRGQHTVYDKKGNPATVNVDDQYIRVSFSSRPTLWGTEEQLGIFFAPGDWHDSYEKEDNTYLAEIDRRVFQLNPQNEQHELKIALFLVEEWRYRAWRGTYGDPITMADLLAHSVIEVDKPNLTSRFAPRIEHALENLRQRGIIGAYECLTSVDKGKRNWGKAWLAARWRIVPPDTLMQSYIAKGITKNMRQLPPGPTGSSKKPTQKRQ